MSPKTLSRRTCLQGLGVALALPMLEAMLPRRAWAAGPSGPKRLLFCTVPHGWNMKSLVPAASAGNRSDTLAALAPFAQKYSILTGLANLPASITSREFAGSHARGTGAMLTQSPLVQTSGPNVGNGVSIDQVVAAALENVTRFASLELGTSAGQATGDCEDGYSCSYLNNVSWRSRSAFSPKEINPAALFQRLFGAGSAAPAGNAVADAAAARALAGRRSVLDSVGQDANRLLQVLGRSDRYKLDEYLSAVRTLEKRLDVPPPSAAQCAPGAAPVARPPADYGAHLRLMADVIALALQCDQTRVLTFMFENPFHNRSFASIGVSGNHHEISHHGGSASKLAALAKIDAFHMAQFAYLLGRLDAVTEGDRTLLDNSAVVLMAEFGDPDDHYHRDIPMVLAGSAGGALNPGRHIQLPNARMADVYLSLVGAMGLNIASFGTDGSGAYGTRPVTGL